MNDEGIVITPPDVQDALEDFDYYNSNMPGRISWARLEITFAPSRAVRLYIGKMWCDRKEIPTHRIDYILQKDGSVYKNYAPGL